MCVEGFRLYITYVVPFRKVIPDNPLKSGLLFLCRGDNEEPARKIQYRINKAGTRAVLVTCGGSMFVHDKPI